MKKMYENSAFSIVRSDKPEFVKFIVTYQVDGKTKHTFIYVEKQADCQIIDYYQEAEKRFKANWQKDDVKPIGDKKASFKIPFIVTLVAFLLAGGTFGVLLGLGYIGGGGKGPSKTYEVHFLDKESKQEISETQTVEYDHVVQRPEVPTKEGYTFNGWFNDKDEPFNFDEKLTDLSIDKIDIFGTFNVTMCHVTYIVNGGVVDGPDQVDTPYGFPIEKEPTVEVGGGTIACTWYTTKDFESGSEFTFGESGTPVKSKILTVYGKAGGERHPDDFENDPWDLFLDEIYNKSFIDISTNSAYKDDFATNKNTFVGLKREIEIEDAQGASKQYNVLVVDENTSAESGDNKFTFMITDLDKLKPTKFDNAYNYYPDSDVNQYLQAVLTGFESDVKGRVASSTIDCLKIETEEEKEEHIEKITDVKIYIPSAQQIFGDGEYAKEDSQFKYFEDTSKVSDLNGAWLRTPPHETAQRTYYVNSGVAKPDFVYNTHSVAPVFVIK